MAKPGARPESGASTFRLDLVAGLTAAAVVIPKAMAYAAVAGLPVVVGLYTAVLPMVVYALLGSSRVLSVSTTTTLAILAGTNLSLAVPDNDPARLVTATATLAVLTGLILLAAGALRLGFVANFISEPVLTGFKAGIGLVIILDQIPKLLGLHLPKGGFFQHVASLAQSIPQTSMISLAVGAGTILVVVAMDRLLPNSPAPLVGLGGAVAASVALNLQALGVDTVGLVPRGLPPFTLPDVALVEQLLPGAAGLALMSFAETIAVGRAFARENDPPVKANRELAATGISNLAGAFFGAMPSGGGTSQTAVVHAAGGRTQVASLVTAGAAALVMILLAPFIGLIPQPALAAIIIVTSIGLIKPLEFVRIRQVRTMEFRWALVACLAVPIFGTLRGIVIAILVSLLALLARLARPRISVLARKPGSDIFRPRSADHPEDESFPGLLLLRPEDRIFFANIQGVRERMQALLDQHKPRILALDLSAVPDIEYSGLKVLIDAERKGAERGIKLWLIGLNPEVLQVVRRCGLADRLGQEAMFFNVPEAVAKFDSLVEAPAESAGRA